MGTSVVQTVENFIGSIVGTSVIQIIVQSVGAISFTLSNVRSVPLLVHLPFSLLGLLPVRDEFHHWYIYCSSRWTVCRCHFIQPLGDSIGSIVGTLVVQLVGKFIGCISVQLSF